MPDVFLAGYDSFLAICIKCVDNEPHSFAVRSARIFYFSQTFETYQRFLISSSARWGGSIPRGRARVRTVFKSLTTSIFDEVSAVSEETESPG